VSSQLRRPILDPSAAPSVAARREAVNAANLRQTAAVARAQRDALDLLGRWRAATAKLRITREALRGADEAVVRIRSVYTGGGAGLLEVLDARRQLDDAHQRLADARFEARLAPYAARIR